MRTRETASCSCVHVHARCDEVGGALCCLTLLGHRCAQSGLHDPISTVVTEPALLTVATALRRGRGARVAFLGLGRAEFAAAWVETARISLGPVPGSLRAGHSSCPVRFARAYI